MKVEKLIIKEFDKNFIDDLSNQFDIDYNIFDFCELYKDLTTQIIDYLYREKIKSLTFKGLKISKKIQAEIKEKLIERIYLNYNASYIDYDFNICCYDFNKKIANYLQNEGLIN